MKSIGGDKGYIYYIEAKEKYNIDNNNAKLRDKLIACEKKGQKIGQKIGEHKRAVETAKNFLKMGLTVEQVSIGTGLSINIVKLLKLYRNYTLSKIIMFNI